MSSTDPLPETPTWPNTHSGIPARFLDKARKAKTLVWQGKTVPSSQDPRTEPALPQSVSRENFSTAITELTQSLGAAIVELNDKPAVDNGWYMEHPNTHGMMHVTGEDELVASAVCYPGSTEEVQKVVLWANKYRIPIWPISMGRNLGYGGAAPRVRGSVILDLGKHTPDLGGGSVIGSTLDRGVEIIRPLGIGNILENVAQVRSAEQTIAVQGRPKTDFYTGDGPLPKKVIDREIARLPCGSCAWLYYGMSYGLSHIRKYKLDIIDTEFKKIAGARKVDPKTIPRDNYFWSRDQIAAGVPDLEELLWCNWVPNGSHIAFSPVSPIRGKDAEQLIHLARHRQHEFGVEMFPAFCVALREMHLIVEIVFDKTISSARTAAMSCLRAMVDDAAALGYGEYRTHLAFMDQVASTYNWNDNTLMKFNEQLKDALDPNGIHAAGKSGIWPKRYRGRGWEMGVGKEGVGKEGVEGDGVEVEAGSVKL